MNIIVSKSGKDAKRIAVTDLPREKYLEDYIAANPEALPMDDIREDLRLLMLAQQFPTDVGDLDVLGIDDEGEVYIIETKLFRNHDKRLVIAQMLDYGAALSRRYTDGDEFLTDIDTRISKAYPQGLSGRITEVFGLQDAELVELKASVARNVKDGNFRFVVLMDTLHDRLRDLIVFLNTRSRFSIYAVEMRFYKHEDLEIVIPKLFGAEVVPSLAVSGTRRRWDEESFFKDAEQRLDPREVDAIRRLYRAVVDLGATVNWGTGKTRGSFSPHWPSSGTRGPITVESNGNLNLNFRWLNQSESAIRLQTRLAEAVKSTNLIPLPNDYAERFIAVAPNLWVPKVESFAESLRNVVQESRS